MMIHRFHFFISISTFASTPWSSSGSYNVRLAAVFTVVGSITEFFFWRYCGTSTGAAFGLTIASAIVYFADEYRVTVEFIHGGMAWQISIATSQVAI